MIQIPPPRILAVDDDSSGLDFLVRRLTSWGYSVVTAGGGEEAISLLDNPPDLVITDLRMPGVDGMGLLAHLKRHCPLVPAIVVSVWDSATAAVQALKAGAVDYMTRPIDCERLQMVIEDVLATARAKKAGRGPVVQVYRGEAPYLFISYARKDQHLVYPELEWLSASGYRIWFDQGISPGTEWPEEIADALNRCAFFVVFITSKAVESRNVRNEINFALEERKPFIAIHLELTLLPKGLRLQMGSLQALLEYALTHDDYQRQLRESLPPELRGFR